MRPRVRLTSLLELAAVAYVLLALACAGAPRAAPTATPAPLDAPIVMAPGQSIPLGASAWHMRFVAAEHDSRCPTGVQCIRAGDVTLRFVATDPAGATSDVSVRFGEGDASAAVGPFTLTVVAVAPAPTAGQAIAPGDYRATVVIR